MHELFTVQHSKLLDHGKDDLVVCFLDSGGKISKIIQCQYIHEFLCTDNEETELLLFLDNRYMGAKDFSLMVYSVGEDFIKMIFIILFEQGLQGGLEGHGQ